MKSKKQNADFLHVGKNLLAWYKIHGRDLPFRKTQEPYPIWICEIIFQQTRIEQGLNHYHQFIKRFPNVKALAEAETDEVLLYWKGLGYYSRALNLHKAAKYIQYELNGEFPRNYDDILKLSGVGKYTAAAISSICFDEVRPAVDGNCYRVLSRVFADDFDISNSSAFNYFSGLAHRMMPKENPGLFNQAMMDLGSQICKPKNPLCENCPLYMDCIAFQTGRVSAFPVKTKKTKATDLELTYYFVQHQQEFLIRQRDEDFIWKKLYEFPTEVPDYFKSQIVDHKTVSHQLTHKNLKIQFYHVEISSASEFKMWANENGFLIITGNEANSKSFPKPLENYLVKKAKVVLT